MNWCRIIGHKWQHYFDGVPYSASFKFSAKAGYCRSELIETEFRFCAKCFTNQIRVAHSGDEQVDWRSCQLTVDQLRDKKLSDLGI